MPWPGQGRKGARAAEAVVAGGFRRRRETVGDLDILVASADGPAVVDWFVRYDEVETVVVTSWPIPPDG